jgi:hypothetical protein
MLGVIRLWQNSIWIYPLMKSAGLCCLEMAFKIIAGMAELHSDISFYDKFKALFSFIQHFVA